MNKGIIQQIREQPVQEYNGTLTVKLIEEYLNDIFHPVKPRNITMFTGLEGMWKFNWSLKYGTWMKGNVHTKRLKDGTMYISLFRKEGLYKIKVKANSFKFYKGTILIHQILDVVNDMFAIGDMNAKETKSKMNEVNKFIEKLKDENNK